MDTEIFGLKALWKASGLIRFVLILSSESFETVANGKFCCSSCKA